MALQAPPGNRAARSGTWTQAQPLARLRQTAGRLAVPGPLAASPPTPLVTHPPWLAPDLPDLPRLRSAPPQLPLCVRQRHGPVLRGDWRQRRRAGGLPAGRARLLVAALALPSTTARLPMRAAVHAGPRVAVLPWLQLDGSQTCRRRPWRSLCGCSAGGAFTPSTNV